MKKQLLLTLSALLITAGTAASGELEDRMSEVLRESKPATSNMFKGTQYLSFDSATALVCQNYPEIEDPANDPENRCNWKLSHKDLGNKEQFTITTTKEKNTVKWTVKKERED